VDAIRVHEVRVRPAREIILKSELALPVVLAYQRCCCLLNRCQESVIQQLLLALIF